MATHLEAVMGTVVGITSPGALPVEGLAGAVRALHESDRVFSTWNPGSPMSLLRSGAADIEDLEPDDGLLIVEVLEQCALARELTGGAFDPWAMPGGVDPTGLVKGWAADLALRELTGADCRTAMVNAGGDIAVAGTPYGSPWKIAVRHPFQPGCYAAIVEVTEAIATSGDYERPGQLVDPSTGRTARVAASATVTGPDLGMADALATGLAVAGRSLLGRIDALEGYEGFLITDSGSFYATPGMRFVLPEAAAPSAAASF